MSRLNLAADLKLPLEWVQMATIVYGGRGSGKTYFGSVAAEEAWKQHVRFCVIDVKGDWWGLKSSADGKGEGIPAVVFGGDHQDVPLDENAGAQVADIVAALQQPVIIDLENLSKGKQIKFLAAFFERLYDVNRNPILLLLDEIQRYAPQTIRFASPEMTQCLGAVEDLVKLGRKHGIGVLGFTQRGAGVNKEVSELCDLLTVFRTPGPLDQERVKEWLEANVTIDKLKAVMASISNLKTGTAIIASGHPDLDVFKTIAIRQRETFDSSATPKIGVRRVEPKVLAKPDLEQLAVKMAATIERAKQDDPKELRKAIAERDRKIRDLERQKPVTVAQERVVEKRVEMPVVTEKQLDRILMVIDRSEKLAMGLGAGLSDLTTALRLVGQSAPRVVPPLRVSAPPMMSPVAQPRPAPRPPATKPPADVDGQALGLGERKVLGVLAQWPDGRTQRDLAFLTGYSARASTIGVILSKLRKLDLVEPGQPVRATEAGLAQAGGSPELPMGPELLNYWFSHPRVGEGERKVLRVLVEAFPEPLTHQELGDRTSYSTEASTLGVILSKLRKLGLVESRERKLRPEFAEAIR